jgi:hypothetical protein
MGFFNFKFYRFIGKLCFILIYVFVAVQIYVVDSVEETRKTNNKTFLPYLKILSYIFIFISSICHIKSSFTDAGIITHNNNVEFVEFYTMTRGSAVKEAEIFNKSTRHFLRPPMNDDEDEITSDCEYDDTVYEPSRYFNDETIANTNKEFCLNLSKCNKCNVCRMPGVHHCVLCQGCVYSMDHHCPWMDNCIGQFNQKYFIQYCCYSLLANLLCGFITVYYIVIKQPLV